MCAGGREEKHMYTHLKTVVEKSHRTDMVGISFSRHVKVGGGYNRERRLYSSRLVRVEGKKGSKRTITMSSRNLF